MEGYTIMNNRDIAKVGFAVLAAVMSYNFADTIVHAEETSVEPVKETAPVENQDDLTDVIDAVVEDTNVDTDVPEKAEETDVPEETEDETTTVGGSETSAKLTEGWSSDSLQYVKDGAYVTNSFAEIDGQKYYFDENNYIKWINDIVDEFGNNACVLLFTNEKFDIERARREVKYKDIYLMKGNAVQDLTTMSKCEYIVGPPSTYSEMAAYYGNAMYLNLYNKEQNIRLKEFKTLREIYEAYYNIEIDSDESERK